LHFPLLSHVFAGWAVVDVVESDQVQPQALQLASFVNPLHGFWIQLLELILQHS
jgi:hypothetical protein